MRVWIAAGLVLLPLLVPAAAQRRDQADEIANPLEKDRAAIARGKSFFAAACGGCHGPTGQGGRAPALADSRFVRSAPNRRLFESIRNGVPGSEMPPYTLPDDKLWELVSYLRELNASAFETEVPGDAAAGKALFFGKARCSECHMIRGEGGLLGPDLANIGLSRSLEKIREAVLKPNAAVNPGYRAVTAITGDGRRIEGVARNYSNYAVQIIDRAGKLHLLERAEWKDLHWNDKSVMPDNYAETLTRAELDDLLAFLSRQSTGSAPERRRRAE